MNRAQKQELARINTQWGQGMAEDFNFRFEGRDPSDALRAAAFFLSYAEDLPKETEEAFMAGINVEWKTDVLGGKNLVHKNGGK